MCKKGKCSCAASDTGVFKFLDASTIHVTKADMDKLEAGETDIIAYTYPEGAWVHIPERIEASDLKRDGFSDGFRKAMQKAKGMGCYYLRLDGIGTEHEDLPKNNW